MIDVLVQVTKFIENDKAGIVLDSFMQQMIDLLENYGEKASDNFWVELLKIISFCTLRSQDYNDEIYTKSNFFKKVPKNLTFINSLQIGSVYK
jgi:hypothetical protein